MRKLQVKHVKHWQDGVIGLLGAWLAASPWLLDLHRSTALLATSVTLGVILMLLAVGSMLAPRKWERWAEAALGVAWRRRPGWRVTRTSPWPGRTQW